MKMRIVASRAGSGETMIVHQGFPLKAGMIQPRSPRVG
jgi:hypothetical protein